MFKNPLVQSVLTVLAVLVVVNLFKPQIRAIPVVGNLIAG